MSRTLLPVASALFVAVTFAQDSAPVLSGAAPPFNMTDIGTAIAGSTNGAPVVKLTLPSLRDITESRPYNVMLLERLSKTKGDGTTYVAANHREQARIRTTTHFTPSGTSEVTYLPDEILAWTSHGERIASDRLLEMLKTPKQIIAVTKPVRKSPEFKFYSRLLREDVVFVYVLE